MTEWTLTSSSHCIVSMKMSSGIVEEVGSGVTKIKKGDRVVAAFDFACGSCFFCEKGVHSSCTKYALLAALSNLCCNVVFQS